MVYEVYGDSLDEALMKVKPYMDKYRKIVVMAVGRQSVWDDGYPTLSGVPRYSDDVGVYLTDYRKFPANRPVIVVIYVVEE